MKKWITILLVLAVIGLLTGTFVYIFIYNKPHPNFEKEKAVFTLSAKDMYDQFKAKKIESQQKYNGKVIQISGKLSKVNEHETLQIVVFVFSQGDFGDEGIRCTLLPKFNDEVKALKPGDDINIKGYCTGYNDSDVIFEKCSIVK